ncbi:hypothetical protein PAECIP111893_00366 [Paenibacillus plantiphilus]|uniref:Uncharacterized protein n=1 Tax=Paenibacillus plantiphilus TaxID=2905650 RepID=A0ABM9BTI0_9BACL|nr:DUF6470 family protein [Paenibacillus plantiphilus]CAH1192997.1 hypothetical protein PAECIP111893_00366 [Paenibacillus plantiphilus]
MSIRSHVAVSSGSVYVPLQEMEISRKLSDIDVKYHAAELSISTRNPEITVNWQPVWDSIGLENPLSSMRSRMASDTGRSFETIAQLARDGDMVARSVVMREKNIFGRLGMEKFHRERQLETKLVLMPDTMPKFSVTVYKPDIHIEPHSPEVNPNDIRPRVSLKSLQSNSSGFIDQRI